ncbi:hypothetical protein ACFWIQ_33000 [Kitasatospora sp. NPDC127059]|uniref:hypothetical protein n=1 Tax=unclassified Kitasatospora TaxID=2633591 RepID=UPI00364BF39B
MPKIVSRRPMGPFALTGHIVMMIMTCGLWIPVFLMARRGRKTVTKYKGDFGGQYPPQG